MNKPKIYLFRLDDQCPGDALPLVAGMACAEDGSRVAAWTMLASERIYLRQKMLSFTRKYEAKYPDGYELVDLLDLTDEEYAAHGDLQTILSHVD